MLLVGSFFHPLSKHDNVSAIFILHSILKAFPTVFSFDIPIISPEYFKTQAETLFAVGPDNISEFNVLPGQIFNITFTARDGFSQIISNVISSFIETDFSKLLQNETSSIGINNFGLLRDHIPTELPMSVTGEQGKNLSVVIYSTDAIGVARTEISVNLGQCELGYVFDDDSLSCVCLPELEKLDVTCDKQSLELVKTQDNL